MLYGVEYGFTLDGADPHPVWIGSVQQPVCKVLQLSFPAYQQIIIVCEVQVT